MTPARKVFIAKLREMRKLLQRGWTRCAAARDAYGCSVSVRSKYAVCWCISGAARAVGLPPWTTVMRQPGAWTIADWNDDPHRTKAEVIACIDNSIRALKEAK